MISDFISDNFDTRQMVFCSVGNISDEKILKLFKTYFSILDEKK